MIRHRPAGSGNPYAVDPDQRVPVVPEAGEPFILGALASREVVDVWVEWVVDGVTDRLPARRAGGRTAWQLSPPPLGKGQVARYRFIASHGPGTRWHTVSAASWCPAPNAVSPVGRDRILAGSVSTFGEHRVRFALALAPNERVAGFGERFDRVDQRGHRLDAVVFEQYKDQAATGRTYFPMPFAHVIGGEGWGFHVRTSRRVWFDVGASDPAALWVTVDGPGAEVSFYEGTPAQVLASFLAETGRPEPLPDWVHRLWISGNEWNTQAAVMARADRHAELEIPYGVVVIEAWSDESTFCVFRDAIYEPGPRPLQSADITYPEDGAWPDPTGMVEDLHARGVKVVLWQIPLQKTDGGAQAKLDASTMLRAGYAVREADGRAYRNRGWWFPGALMPDFTNPAARRWWLDKRRYLVAEVGVDGFKTDGGEHAWGADLRYHDGSRGAEANNRFPVEYTRAYHDLLVEEGKAPVTFSRAGHVGSQRYGCTWAGDENSSWEAFRASITAGITAGLCGVTYWGWDLAGFSGEVPTAELYLRSTQAACFMPIMQYHAEFNDHRSPSRDRTPWNIAERSDDPSTVDEFRRWARVREALVPYLAEQSIDSIDRGLPLMRALVLSFPDDERVWEYPLQFLLGDDLLVAPVTRPGASEVEVYLPGDSWTDLTTGATHSPGTFKRHTPLWEAAVFVRSNAYHRFASVVDALTDA